MDLTYFAYPFLFIAVYFEVFLLLTFLSRPAREQRTKGMSEKTPQVAVIVPCYNEETTIKGTIDSLLALEYPADKLHLVLVNDGSKDSTKAVMDTYVGHPQITVIHKENGGKHTAVNLGIESVPEAEFVGCLDADSFVAPDALRYVIGHFDNPKVAAVTAAMSVYQPKNLLEQMQNVEYIFGIALRHTLSSVNGLYVTPGPFSFYRRATIVALGGFRKGHNTEDLEMALRIQRAGLLIENAPQAQVFTKTPKNVPALVKQRTRWTTGFLRNVLYDYRDLIGNPQFGTLGLVVLPLGLVAIIGGISLFTLAVTQTVHSIWSAYSVSHGVPLSFVLFPRFHAFSWFYLPVSVVVFLSTISMIGSISLMFVGKSISRTKGNIIGGIFAYLLFYGLIAPLWLIRTIFDILTGTRRSWR